MRNIKARKKMQTYETLFNTTKAKDRDKEKDRRANGTDGDMNTNENGDGSRSRSRSRSRNKESSGGRGKEDYFSNIQTTAIQRLQFSSYQFDVQIWI